MMLCTIFQHFIVSVASYLRRHCHPNPNHHSSRHLIHHSLRAAFEAPPDAAILQPPGVPPPPPPPPPPATTTTTVDAVRLGTIILSLCRDNFNKKGIEKNYCRLTL